MSAVPSRPAPPLVLRPSRLKWTLMLLGSLTFVALAVWLPRHTGAPMGWPVCAIAFFGLGALVAIVNLIPGASHLRLDPDGFETRTLYRTHKTRWTDVAGFGVLGMSSGRKKMVGWNYLPGRGKPSRLRKFNFDTFGFEAALPDTYGMDVADLVALLECNRLDATARRSS